MTNRFIERIIGAVFECRILLMIPLLPPHREVPFHRAFPKNQKSGRSHFWIDKAHRSFMPVRFACLHGTLLAQEGEGQGAGAGMRADDRAHAFHTDGHIGELLLE